MTSQRWEVCLCHGPCVEDGRRWGTGQGDQISHSGIYNYSIITRWSSSVSDSDYLTRGVCRTICLLIALSLSLQKRRGYFQHPTLAHFFHPTLTFKPKPMSADNQIVSSDELFWHKDWWNPTCQSFFWYDSDKDLERCIFAAHTSHPICISNVPWHFWRTLKLLHS